MGLESMLLEKSSEEKKVNYCNSVMTGIVKKNWSKEHPGCVQVEVLMGETGKTTLEWVRVMQPYCGNGYGEFFIPEINTEVIIGFIMGDLSAPVILGCLTTILFPRQANSLIYPGSSLNFFGAVSQLLERFSPGL